LLRLIKFGNAPKSILVRLTKFWNAQKSTWRCRKNDSIILDL